MASNTLFRRMDAEVHRFLFNIKSDLSTGRLETGEVLPYYSSDLVSANRILERINADGGYASTLETGDKFECCVITPIDYVYKLWNNGDSLASAAPLAIVIALLRAGSDVGTARGDAYVQLEEIQSLG